MDLSRVEQLIKEQGIEVVKEDFAAEVAKAAKG